MNRKFIEGCRICPRACKVRRMEGKRGYCGATGDIMISRAAPHYWEEPCISGMNGSGAVFFSGCNLHCVYCQNKAISDGGAGKKVSIERLSEIFLELQSKNVYNINLVTPTHYAPEIREAVLMAKANGLKLPVIYNCGGYESVETLKILEDTVDIWMPDFKYISSETAKRYSDCPEYFEVAIKAIDEMSGQIRRKGGIKFIACGENDESREMIMVQGIIVRHLLLPERIGESKRILRFLHERYGNDIYISIMSQYTPMKQILENDRFPELKNKVSREEYNRLVKFALKIGIENAYIQEEDVASESFIPSFDGEGV